MKRKVEDQLIELAFGDFGPEEARRLEEQAATDPVAARALADYRDMRASLRAMADVPEHQLSNERLRDAILARGLSNEQTKPAGSPLGWIWMPLTACAMAFTLVMWRNTGPEATPEIVMNPNVSDRIVLDREPIKSPFEEVATSPVKVTDVAATETRSLTAASAREVPKPVKKTPGGESQRQYVARMDKASTATDLSPSRDDVREPIVMKAPPVSLEEDLPPVVPEQPIVLIAQERDLETGAQVATEVQSESNVLVGG